MKKLTQTPLLAFFATLVIIGLMSLLGPQEKSLGANVRIVYLHGAWVLVAETAFILAGIIGALGLVSAKIPFLAKQQAALYKGSAAMGLTGLVFWVTYLPLSMWAMQANWSGLIPGRTAIPTGAHFCRCRHPLAGQSVALWPALADRAGQYCLYHNLALHLLECRIRHAPAALADFWFRHFSGHPVFRQSDYVHRSGGFLSLSVLAESPQQIRIYPYGTKKFLEISPDHYSVAPFFDLLLLPGTCRCGLLRILYH
jgi:hypothetical protein